MENTNIVTPSSRHQTIISASNAIFNVQHFRQLTAFNLDGRLTGDGTGNNSVQGKPADCMAIVMQAMAMGHEPLRCGAENTPLTVFLS